MLCLALLLCLAAPLVSTQEYPFFDVKKIVQSTLDLFRTSAVTPPSVASRMSQGVTAIEAATPPPLPEAAPEREHFNRLFHLPADIVNRLAADAGYVDSSTATTTTTKHPFIRMNWKHSSTPATLAATTSNSVESAFLQEEPTEAPVRVGPALNAAPHYRGETLASSGLINYPYSRPNYSILDPSLVQPSSMPSMPVVESQLSQQTPQYIYQPIQHNGQIYYQPILLVPTPSMSSPPRNPYQHYYMQQHHSPEYLSMIMQSPAASPYLPSPFMAPNSSPAYIPYVANPLTEAISPPRKSSPPTTPSVPLPAFADKVTVKPKDVKTLITYADVMKMAEAVQMRAAAQQKDTVTSPRRVTVPALVQPVTEKIEPNHEYFALLQKVQELNKKSRMAEFRRKEPNHALINAPVISESPLVQQGNEEMSSPLIERPIRYAPRENSATNADEIARITWLRQYLAEQKQSLSEQKKLRRQEKKIEQMKAQQVVKTNQHNAEKTPMGHFELRRQHCLNIRSFARQFGVLDIRQFAIDNCAFVQHYYPSLSCEHANSYAIQCYNMLKTRGAL